MVKELVKMIEEVSFEIISKCPNNCLHCSSDSSMVSNYIYSVEKIKEIVKQLSDLSVKRICLSGGEPFLHPNLLDIVKEITGNNISCDIYTAGIVLEKNISCAISKITFDNLKKNGAHRILFNLQAIDENIYNDIMGTNGYQQYLFESIKNANQSGLFTEIHFVPMKRNINQIDKVIAFAYEAGISQVSFLKLVCHGRAEKHDLELTKQEDIDLKKYLRSLSSVYTNIKIRIGIPLTYEKSMHGCHAATNKIYIKYDGSVFGCEAFKYIKFKDIEVPNIKTASIESIINKSAYFSKSRNILCQYTNGDSNCPVQNYLKKKGNN